MRAEPAAVGLFRSADDEQSMNFGSVRPIVWPTPEFATSPMKLIRMHGVQGRPEPDDMLAPLGALVAHAALDQSAALPGLPEQLVAGGEGGSRHGQPRR